MAASFRILWAVENVWDRFVVEQKKNKVFIYSLTTIDIFRACITIFYVSIPGLFAANMRKHTIFLRVNRDFNLPTAIVYKSIHFTTIKLKVTP